jgi:hypothetical protein
VLGTHALKLGYEFLYYEANYSQERVNLQFRFDFQNPFHNYGFNNPSNTYDYKNPQLFGKITGDQTTASFNGQPLVNLMLKLSF